jgi:hypothetical protein
MASAELLLLAYAAAATGYSMPAQAPQIIPKPAAFFLSRPECQGEADCSIDGLFVPNVKGRPVIYVQKRLVGVYGDSVRVHELTHFLQLTNHAYLERTCPNSLAREAEADRVQSAYINSVMAREGKPAWVWNSDPRSCDQEATAPVDANAQRR